MYFLLNMGDFVPSSCWFSGVFFHIYKHMFGWSHPYDRRELTAPSFPVPQGPQQMKQDKVFACHPCYKVWPRCGAYGMLMWFLVAVIRFLVPGDSTKWPSEGILVHRWGKWCLIPGDAILTKFRSVRSASSAAGWRRRMARNMLPRRFF